MMKLCLASYGGRLAALFETASEFPCYELEPDGGDAPVFVASYTPAHCDPCMRLAALREQGVTTLICGGICRRLTVRAEAAGLHIIPWICGDNETVLAACVDGTLSRLTMPGCRRAQHATHGLERQVKGEDSRDRNRIGGRRSGRRQLETDPTYRRPS